MPSESDDKPNANFRSDVEESLKAEADAALSDLRRKAFDTFHEGQDRAVGHISGIADAARSASEALSRHDQRAAARLTRDAAVGLERAAGTLSSTNPEELIQSVRRIAREYPAGFAAGAVLAGFALGRFLRATTDRERATPARPVETPADREQGRIETFSEESSDAQSAPVRGPSSNRAA